MVHHGIVNIAPCALQWDLVFILCVTVYTSQLQLPPLPLPSPLPTGNYKSVLLWPQSVSVSQIDSFVSYFRFHM